MDAHLFSVPVLKSQLDINCPDFLSIFHMVSLKTRISSKCCVQTEITSQYLHFHRALRSQIRSHHILQALRAGDVDGKRL